MDEVEVIQAAWPVQVQETVQALVVAWKLHVVRLKVP